MTSQRREFSCLDVPNIEAVIVEVPSPSHPFGVRGVGEMSIVPPPGAIANAIHSFAVYCDFTAFSNTSLTQLFRLLSDNLAFKNTLR